MDGPHTIYPDTPDLTNFSLQVSCDQETGGGGWIMYMRRLNGTVDFSRNWDDYKRGFGQNGDNMTELWLGNENVYQVLQSYGTTECELRIEMDAWDETERWLVASHFRMNNETSKYTLNWDNVTGPYPEIYSNWNYHKLLEFRTNDSENPHCVGSVDQYTGGWWYECSSLFLTGKYVNEEVKTYKSISVVDSKHGYPLKRARLMLRPTNDNRSCDNPCKNGGTCEHVADPIGHHCACTSERCGATCEVMNPCNNSGKCEAEQLPTGDYRTYCTCTPEWCGVTCDVLNPCKNGGVCEVDAMTNTTTCTCDAELTGVTCESVTREDTVRVLGMNIMAAAPVFAGQEDSASEDAVAEENIDEDILLEDVAGQDTTGENTTGENTTGEDTTGENTAGQDTTGENTAGQDTTGDNTTGENTTGQEDTTGDDTSDDDMTGDDIIREDTTRGDSNRDDTTGDESDPAAYGASSAACVTTNCGVIVAVLILRRRLFGFFGL